MKTVLYANKLENIGGMLEDIIHEQVPGIKVEVCNSIDGLSQKFRQLLNNVSVVILLVAFRDELVQLNYMSPLFENTRVVLILPDRRKDTLALGFRLKTSFVSYIDSDLQDVASVLRQILKKAKEKMQNG
ncbi:hypothetical protein [Desulfobacula toluolica]|uniref:Uncharacterized protein n=1 Tax=Desulfobacula toluolica (strain DSM 7467 / Tol2) TaxID=651182 RepID=K0N3E4_DESTT|nr:hypothetical protein [Desulfobacula toluolica]CCK78639.1 uncharacterized protein TOL2_C04700 [Desulfobacula toluolica Tol2]